MIITLSGSNSFLISQKLKELKDEFIKKYGTEGVERYNGAQLTSAQLNNILVSISLFTAHKFVVISRLSEQKDLVVSFLEILERIPKESIIVLKEDQLDKRTVLYKTLKQQDKFCELNELPEAELVDWIKQFTKGQGGTITASNARTLYTFIGADQLRLSNEIMKLVAYAPEITKENIELLVEKSSQETVFELLDAALSGRRKQALTVLDNLEQAHADPFQMVNMLVWQAQVLAVVWSARNKSEGEVAKETKINPYVLRKTKNLISHMDLKKFRSIIDSISRLDITLKTTSNDPWRVMEQTILTF